MAEQTRREIDFVMFVVYRLAEAWGESARQVYRLLDSVGAIRDYLIAFYDVLHTLGEEYLVRDVTDYLRTRGALA